MEWVQVIEYSPTHYGVAYVELRHGKAWRHDITMNLSLEEAIAHAERRCQLSGLPCAPIAFAPAVARGIKRQVAPRPGRTRAVRKQEARR